MKIIVVGGVAGGATTVARLRRLDEHAQIILFERGNHISFANCGLPYYIGDVIQNKEELLLQTPKSFQNRFGVEVRVGQEVIQINRTQKTVVVKQLQTGKVYEESYEKLVLSPGAEPINPFQNLKTDKVRTLRSVDDAVSIKDFLEKQRPKKVAIIGGGYIGVEMAENLSKYEKMEIAILEKANHLIAPLDEDMANIIHKNLQKHGVKLYLNCGVEAIEESKNSKKLKLTLENNQILEADFVILSIGVKPETTLAKQCGLTVNQKGSILVNEWMQTSDPDIYALGDAVQVTNYVTKLPAYIPLAGPANKQARVVANHICNITSQNTSYQGTVGSSILKIYEYTLGMTGINEATCKVYQLPYRVIILSPYSHATYYPGATLLTIKALYEPKTGKLLGAQVWGKNSVDKITDILATAIRMDMTAYDLEQLELCYAPPFSSAKSPVNLLGNAIENELNGLAETITWEEVEKQENPYILDVRTKEEYESSHIAGAVFIPLDELRQNLAKLEKNKTILVYCHTGLRSYLACRILNQNGFSTKNITGGYSFYKQTH